MGRSERITPVGAELIGAIREIADAVRSGEPLEEQFTVRTYIPEVRPRSYGPDDVRRVRDSLGVSPQRFADFLGTSQATVQSWEQGIRKPSAMARRFMDEIALAPEHFSGRFESNAGPGAGSKTAPGDAVS